MKTNSIKTGKFILFLLAGLLLLMLFVLALSTSHTVFAAENKAYLRILGSSSSISEYWTDPHTDIYHSFSNSGNVLTYYTIQAYFGLNDNYEASYYAGDTMTASLTYHRSFNNNKTYSDTQTIGTNNKAVSETRTFSGLMLNSVDGKSETYHTVSRDQNGNSTRETFIATVIYK